MHPNVLHSNPDDGNTSKLRQLTQFTYIHDEPDECLNMFFFSFGLCQRKLWLCAVNFPKYTHAPEILGWKQY